MAARVGKSQVVSDLVASVPGVEEPVDGGVVHHRVPLVLVREWNVDELERL